MITKNQKMSATAFKAKCLSLMNELQDHGGRVTITKRGRPVATLGASAKRTYPSPEGRWALLFPDLPHMEPADYDMPWEPTDLDRIDR